MEWIACNERMPPEDTPVLVWYVGLDQVSGAAVANYNAHECRIWNITHWQPLPPPPK